MPVSPWSPDDDAASYRHYTARRSAQQSLAGKDTASIAARIKSIRKVHPHLAGSQALWLADQGFDANSKETKDFAKAAEEAAKAGKPKSKSTWDRVYNTFNPWAHKEGMILGPAGWMYNASREFNSDVDSALTEAGKPIKNNPVTKALGGAMENVGSVIPEPVRDVSKATSRQAAIVARTPFEYVRNTALTTMRPTLDHIAENGLTPLSMSEWKDQASTMLQSPGGPLGYAGALITPKGREISYQAGKQTTISAEFEKLDKAGFAESLMPGGLSPSDALAKADVQTGEGFFLGIDNNLEPLAGQYARQYRGVVPGTKTILNPEGNAWTFGRSAAYTVSEPGTKPYNIISGLVDAGSEFFGDPVNPLTAGLGKSAKAAKGFRLTSGADELVKASTAQDDLVRLAGARKGVMKYLDAPSVEQFFARDLLKVDDGLLEGERGKSVIQNFTLSKDPAEIRRWTKGQLGNKLNREIAQTDTMDETMSVLRDHLGIDISEQPKWMGGFNASISQKLENTRFAGMMPDQAFNPRYDADGTMENVMNSMRNAKVPIEEQDRIYNMMSDTAYGSGTWYNEIGWHNVKKEVETVMANAIGKPGDDAARKAVINKVVSFEQKALTDEREYFVRATANGGIENVHLPWVTPDGKIAYAPNAQLESETMQAMELLPDPREIRRFTSSPFFKMMARPESDAYENVVASLDNVYKRWKQAKLTRIGYPIRQIAEDQAHLMMIGSTASFAHPMQYMGYLVAASKQNLDAIAKETPEGFFAHHINNMRNKLTDRYAMPDTDLVTDTPWMEDEMFLKNIGQVWGDLTPDRRAAMHNWEWAQKGSVDYMRGLLGVELRQLHGSQFIRRTLEHANFQDGVVTNMDELTDWLLAADQRKMFRKLIAISGSDIDDVLKNPEVTREFARQTLQYGLDRVMEKTKNHPDLVSIVRTGKLADGTKAYKGNKINKDALVRLEGLLNDPEIDLPAAVKFRKSYGVTPEGVGGWIDNAFGWLASYPMDKLTRNPAFVERYFDNLLGVFQRIDPEERVDLLMRMKDEMPTKLYKKFQEVAQTAHFEESTFKHVYSTIDAETASYIAKTKALDDIRRYMFDMSSRNNGMDVLRFILPFGEAMRDVVSAWSKTIIDHPNTLNRVRQLRQGTDHGFFERDPMTGEIIFKYPLIGGIMEKMGVAGDVVSNVMGLNMVTQGSPGVGPVITLPAAFLLPNTPQYDQMESLLFPYGRPAKNSIFQTLGQEFTPAWAHNFFSIAAKETDTGFNRRKANYVAQAAMYKMSTGDYDLSKPGEKERLIADAQKASTVALMVRGFTQASSPAAPSINFKVETTQGMRTVKELKEELMTMRKDSPTTYIYDFLQKYGEGTALVLTPSATDLVAAVPTSKEGEKWVRQNSDIRNDYRDVYGVFAPEDTSYAYEALIDGVARGDAKYMTTDERIEMAMNMVAQSRYDHFAAQYPDPDSDQKEILKEYKATLKQLYPGSFPDNPKKKNKSVPEMVEQLERAVNDKRLKNNKASKAIKKYLEWRNELLAVQAQEELSTNQISTSDKVATQRQALYQAGTQLAEANPAFLSAWENIFLRELLDERK